MGKAGKALKQTLERHGISQNQLAIALGIERSIVFRWFHEQTDPTAETVVQLTKALKQIQPSAAKSFVDIFIGDFASNEKISQHIFLPDSQDVDVAILSQIFKKRSSSYKYLFFLSLLDILERRNFETSSPISFSDLVTEMLANSWFPHAFFKLSFGTQDKITEKLDELNIVISKPILKFNDPDKKLLRKTIQNQLDKDLISDVVKYVPFRLIRPFFNKEVKGLKDKKINQSVMNLANAQFESKKPLYHFDSELVNNCTGIIFSQDWANYIENNFSIVKGWGSWEWLQYMQLRNPSTPNIINKLFVPQHRGSLASQTKFWKSFLKHHHTNCIYSGQLLNQDNFSLDHYLPWSFVAHDQLWNIIPTIPEINSSKSNHLPSKKYFAEFVRLQHLALLTNYENLPQQTWTKAIDPYISDLKINTNDLLDYKKLCNAYESTIEPLKLLAMKQGFPANWEYAQ